MADNLIDQIVGELRVTLSQCYPDHGGLRNLRVVGHAPKTGHYVYDIVADFDQAPLRLSAKVYRSGRGNSSAQALAKEEIETMDAMVRRFDGNCLPGLSRPLGDFSRHAAVVTEKPPGMPLQSIIMKAALLPAYSELTRVGTIARECGVWLRKFHERTSLPPMPFYSSQLLEELDSVCVHCKGSGLDEGAIQLIVNGSKNALRCATRNLPSSIVLNDFTPLNIAVGDQGVGVYDYSRTVLQGSSLDDVATFMACVEALEKYPFCNRDLVMTVQDEFCAGYKLAQADEGIVRVLKMKRLLGMFAQGRSNKDTAMRKKIMWANIMKRFIQNAAERSMTAA